MSTALRACAFRSFLLLAVGFTTLALSSGIASAQKPYGFATLSPGTLNYTTSSAVAKVLKEKAGMNILVQPTAGDTAIIPMVNRGEAELGIANVMEVADGFKAGAKGSAHRRGGRTPTAPRSSCARIQRCTRSPTSRASAWRSAIPPCAPSTRSDARHARDGRPDREGHQGVLVPNVVRSADDFVSGAADMFYFAFGAPKVREVDATVGGIRVLEIDEKGMPEARKIMPYGYLTPVDPGPVFIGVEKPMKVYSFDDADLHQRQGAGRLRLQDSSKRLDKNKADLVAVQPVLREFTLRACLQAVRHPVSPGRAEVLQRAQHPSRRPCVNE